MEVKVCKNCRRLYKHLYGPELCPECAGQLARESAAQDAGHPSAPQEMLNKGKSLLSVKCLIKEEEEKFRQVRDYIMTHPRASVAQISEVNGITPARLFEWIRDERLEFSEDSRYAWLTCIKCGAKIKSGRLCNWCR